MPRRRVRHYTGVRRHSPATLPTRFTIPALAFILSLLTWLPATEPERSRVARAVAGALLDRARGGGDPPRGMLLEEIDGLPAATHALAPHFVEAGFVAGAMGLQGSRRA